MKPKFAILTILFLLQIHLCVVAQTALDSLTQVLQEIEAQNTLPGFAVAIVNTDEILLESGYGYSDIEKNKPYTPATLQNIGSVSKTFIGFAVAKCIEDGLLTLDTKVNDILPFEVNHPNFPKEPILLKHLVTHTSGLKDSPIYNKSCYVLKEGEEVNKENYTISERLAVSAISKSKMIDLGDFLESYFVPNGKHYKAKNFTKDKPGLEYEYSNIASALAAYMVEIVTQRPFDRFVVEEVMRPLGMASSGFKFEDIEMSKHAVLYSKKGGVIPKYSLVTYPDGGVLSSTHDLAIYIQQMMKGLYGESNIINSGSYKNLFHVHSENGKNKTAIFWGINKRGFINHNGSDPGILTIVQIHPEEKFGMVFTTNCSADKKSQIDAVKKIWRTMYKKGKMSNK